MTIKGSMIKKRRLISTGVEDDCLAIFKRNERIQYLHQVQEKSSNPNQCS